ncbi:MULTISPECIES: rhomboid family intramembrane serine protease [Haloferax]|uniref:Rhomboid family intramembrane serine protease n=1 Tax=Haloferax marinum TaxID=2666143 RepID=A0A6A8G7N8_9EURY|nr:MULTISPECIES: rhomboid family intramembrane serine protease [Haloferax]KAB1198079.1 rhomboid family intramembrane serine protease [Haloferax sp. CBA1150]MRW97149.1 rhomboid family intramembrane serine protease [Haloferax marinum]
MADEYRSFVEDARPGTDETLAEAIVWNPVVQTLTLMVVVSVATWLSTFAGFGRDLFVLTAPLAAHPWTLVTSVYAHVGPGHLLSNAVVLVVAGGLVAMSTSWLRFHLFFVVTGATAGAVQVLALSLFGLPIGVLGASGAVFALVGYVLTSNILSKGIFDRLRVPSWAVLLALVVIALVLTMQYSAPGSALVAHFTGATVGLVAGRFRLLHV